MRRSTVFAVFFLFVFDSYAYLPPDYYNISPSNELRDDLHFSIQLKHISIGYKAARKQLFGYLYLEGQSHETYSLKTTYCQITITNNDLPATSPLAPLQIPDHRLLNTEHAWPQSHFSDHFSEELQKADLHILFPEQSNVNSLRSNHPFGNVVKSPNSPCAGAALGKSATGRTVFEPHDHIKGNIARALFYFSVRYIQTIDPAQEATLREWHQNDPVDAEEEEHNDRVFKIQKNRNPFIDNPLWVEQIQDF